MDVLEVVPFDLGLFPALRHFKIQLWISSQDNVTMLSFLKKLFTISSLMSGLETLEITITWDDVRCGNAKDLFLYDLGWSALDEVLTCEKFVSLNKVVLDFGLETRRGVQRDDDDDDDDTFEFERDVILPYVDDILPLFRGFTNTWRTLETNVQVTYDPTTYLKA